jgi:hypothetical protein
MKCSLCDKVALYQASKKGFCRDHRAEACVATLKDCAKKASINGVESYRKDGGYGWKRE